MLTRVNEPIEHSLACNQIVHIDLWQLLQGLPSLIMRSRAINKISIAIFLPIVPSALISILFNDIYQDGEWANAQWLGQDIVTLLIAVPILMVSYFCLKRKGNGQWKLVQTGILLYLTYTYTFFVFEAELTWLYLFHLPIFGLSLAGLGLNLISLFTDRYYLYRFNNNFKWAIIAYQGVIAVMLSILWITDIVTHLISPDHHSDTPSGEAPLIIYTLDLGIIVPLLVISIIGLLGNKQYGILLSGIMLVKSSTIGFSLMAMSISMYVHNIHLNVELIVLWCFIGCIGSILTILFFKNIDYILPLNPKTTNISIEFQEYQLN